MPLARHCQKQRDKATQKASGSPRSAREDKAGFLAPFAFAFNLPLEPCPLNLNPLNLLPAFNDTTLARATAVLLTLGLFTIGSIPTAGHAFPGAMHWAAHLAAYALIAFTFGLGWPKRSLVQIAVFVAAIGIVHETTEIITHSHVFETEDAIVNAVGALAGVAIQQITKRAITR